MQKFNFGKYKEQYVGDIIHKDVDYCMWLINNVQWTVFSDKQLMLIENKYYEKYRCYPLQLTSTALRIKYNGVCLGDLPSDVLYGLYNTHPELQWAIKKVHNSRRVLRMFDLRQPAFQTDDI